LHFGRADNAYNINISALSRGIHQLADELAALLFVRDNGRVA
jgi:DNA-binding transcriptional LysR family regulator